MTAAPQPRPEGERDMPPLRRILCIDDERDILDVAKMCLEVLGGYEVAVCESGQGGLEQAAASPPDLILLDVMMPDMNGPETLEALQADAVLAHIPVIFVTARVQAEEVRSYLRLGAVAVIPKPFDPMALAGQVREIWETMHG